MKRYNIRLQLGATFGVLIALLFFVGWQSIRHLRQLNQRMQDAIGERCSDEQTVAEAFRLSNLNSRITLSVFLMDDMDAIKRLLVQCEDNTRRISELIRALAARPGTEEEKRLLAALEAARKPYFESYGQSLKKRVDEHQFDEGRKEMVSVTLPRLAIYHEAWNNFARYQFDEIAQAIKQSKADFVVAQRQLLFQLMLACGLTLTTAVFVTHRVTREAARRARAEDNLRPLHNQLEQPVQQRTAALLQTNQSLQVEMSERKQVSEALVTEQELLNSLITATPDTVYFKDRESRFLRVNEALARKHGLSNPSALLGKTDFDFFGEQHARQAFEDEQRIMATGQPMLDTEEQEDWTDGRIAWVSSTKLPLRDSAGKIVGIMGISRDITAHKLAEEALRESERRLAHAMSLARLVAWEYDVASGLFTFSDPFYALHGTTAELEGGNRMSAEAFVRKFMHPDDAHFVAEEVAKAVATADPDYQTQLESRTIHRDGELRYVLVNIAIAKDAAGRTVQLRGANQDITERKKAEEQLRNLWRAVEQTPATVVITDFSGNIEYVNPMFVETTGYRVTEALGQNPRVLKSGLHDASFYKVMWDTLLQGNVWQGEFHNKKKNGDCFWESASISPVRDPKGKITHFIAVKEDITERKQAQAERENLERQLAGHKANEESARLALEHEQKSSRMKDRFVSMVSHEFRTPLSIINMAAELLDGYWDKMSEAERTEHLKEIQSSVGRMTQMMNDFLLHANCASGKLACQPARVEVAALCRRLIAEVASQAGPPRAIECLIDPAVGEAWLDEKILRHILGNLLSNAVKYSSTSQSVKLEVKRVAGSASSSSAATHLEFKVADAGIGIPAADMAKLYQTFHRAANVGHRPGTGMGLAIVKQFVDLQRGTIRFESQEGKGTTVWVELPVCSPGFIPSENGGSQETTVRVRLPIAAPILNPQPPRSAATSLYA